MSNLIIGGAKHNVIFVVTEHDMAYAFDANTFAQLWTVSLLGSNETTSDARNCGQVTPEIGITSTPAIDPTAGQHGTMWVVAMSKDNSSNYFQRLHAIDITTGADIEPPQTIQATFSQRERTYHVRSQTIQRTCRLTAAEWKCLLKLVISLRRPAVYRMGDGL